MNSKFKLINKKWLLVKLFDYINIKLNKYRNNIIIDNILYIIVFSIFLFIIFFIPIYISKILKLHVLIGTLFIYIYNWIIFYISWRLKNTYNFIDENWNKIDRVWFYTVEINFSKEYDNEIFVNYMQKGYILVSRITWILWNTEIYNILDKNKKLVFNNWFDSRWGLIESILEETEKTKNALPFKPLANIKIIWIGWSWINATNKMIKYNLLWSEFITLDKDLKALENSLANIKINLTDNNLNKKIIDLLKWTDMIFLVSWFWWNTWSKYLSKIAELSKRLWILTIGVITKPSINEWLNKNKIYKESIKWLKHRLDTLIVIKNDNILKQYYVWSNLIRQKEISDEIIFQTVSWITDTINLPNLIAVDFSDIKRFFHNSWNAFFWMDFWIWKNRINDLIKKLFKNPLLEHALYWATKILFILYFSIDMSALDVVKIIDKIQKWINNKVSMFFTYTIDENLNNEIKLNLIAINNHLENNEWNQYLLLKTKIRLLSHLLDKKWIISKSELLNDSINFCYKWYKVQADTIIKILEISVKNKLYNKVVKFAEYIEEYNLQVYDLMITDYYILIWASYQELWNLQKANNYFDIFIKCIKYRRKTDKEYEKKVMNTFNNNTILNKKLMVEMIILISSLEKLGLDYKIYTK